MSCRSQRIAMFHRSLTQSCLTMLASCHAAKMRGQEPRRLLYVANARTSFGARVYSWRQLFTRRSHCRCCAACCSRVAAAAAHNVGGDVKAVPWIPALTTLHGIHLRIRQLSPVSCKAAAGMSLLHHSSDRLGRPAGRVCSVRNACIFMLLTKHFYL